MNKYEQLIEHIINDEADKARALFHNIVVEKSRDIYESLIDETDLEETIGGNEVEDLVDEVSCDEEGLSEDGEEEEMAFGDEGDNDMDFDDSGDLDDHEEEHGDVEDRVQDLEAALDELKAEFDALMAGEEAEEEQFPGIHGDEDGEEDYDSEESDEEAMFESEEDDEEEDDEEELDENIVREYVEKVGETSQKSEGGEVGKGSSAPINKQSIVAKKNDMGGSAGNIVKGGTAKGGSVKKPQEINSGNINVPGGKAGNAFNKKQTSWEKAKGAEGQTTSGKLPVSDKSILKSRKS